MIPNDEKNTICSDTPEGLKDSEEPRASILDEDSEMSSGTFLRISSEEELEAEPVLPREQTFNIISSFRSKKRSLAKKPSSKFLDRKPAMIARALVHNQPML